MTRGFAGRGWEASAPLIFEVVTGFFPEAKPKPTWATNPRPLLVCGVATDDSTGEHFVRIAYGSKRMEPCGRYDIPLGNLAKLDALNLPHPTRFVLSAKDLVILPWTKQHFRPWTRFTTPRIGRFDEELRREVQWAMAEQWDDVPQF